MNKKTCNQIMDILAKAYPDARPELEFSSRYELLIAVMLSAQCTDRRVNMVTRVLFDGHNTPETMLELSQEKLEEIIRPCGLFRSKAKHVLSASRDIIEKFGGQVPDTVEKLQTLQGVGRKTANVVYSVGFGGQAIAVDTHVFRVSNRLGLASATTPAKTEEALNRLIDRDLWGKAHHYLIFHGRRICHAQRPDCDFCPLKDLCTFYKNGGKLKGTSAKKDDKKAKKQKS